MTDSGIHKLWEPFPKQAEFLSLPFDVKEALYGGAAGGGKSDVLVAIPVYYGLHEHPRFKGIIFRRTYPELEKELVPRAERLYKPFGATYNGQTHTFEFPSGARVFLSYLDSDAAARSHDTNEYNYVGFDELTHFSKFQYTYLVGSRMRTSVGNLPVLARSASNPGNVGHAWVRARFVEPCPEGGKPIYDEYSKSYRFFIRAFLTDNPALMEAQPDYIDQLRMLPLAEQKAKIDGDWWAYSGQVFTEWRERKYPDEPENALHVIPRFNIPEWWPKLAAIDWGFRAMTWIGWAAISPDGRVFLYREYARKKENISKWASNFAHATQGDRNIIGVWLDPSAWQRRGDDESIAEQFQRWSGFVPRKANNDRIAGKQLLHDFLRWEPRPERYSPLVGFEQETYNRIYRMEGLVQAENYKKLFEPEAPETNIPLLQIFDNCPEVIKAIPQACYSETRPEDIEEFEGDDPLDGVRYLVCAAREYLTAGSKEHATRVARESIVKKFDETQDATMFYNMMRIFEAKERKKTSGVRFRRFH